MIESFQFPTITIPSVSIPGLSIPSIFLIPAISLPDILIPSITFPPATTPEPTPVPTPVPAPTPEGYKLIWSDEFDSTDLDSSKWSNTYGQVHISNSDLVLGGSLSGGEIRSCTYDSNPSNMGHCKLPTKFQFLYGYVEWKAKFTNIPGYCNQLWTATIPGIGYGLAGEFDVTETGSDHINSGDAWDGIDRTNSHTHCCGYQPSLGETGPGISYRTGKDLSGDYHIYSMEWTSSYVRFLFDNIETWRSSYKVIQTPQMVIIGLSPGSWPVKAKPLSPGTMYVDYIRVYQKGG